MSASIDVDRLARAIRGVEFRHDKELVWAAADNIAEAIAAEYARLSGESMTPEYPKEAMA